MTTYTINKIQAEMQSAGSHWWDKGSMRFFKCRVGEQVYQGEGGIYFVTSEKSDHSPRAYSVRQYSPETKRVSTIGDFNSLTRAKAHKLAKELAGPAAIVAAEAHKPLSEAEQLALDIRRGGGQATATSAAWLIRLATRHQKLMVDYCNGDAQLYGADDELLPEPAELRATIEEAAKQHGCGVKLGGDPRGCTAKLILPNGDTNDWGKEGWCVPVRD
jgi:hypothetical protein